MAQPQQQNHKNLQGKQNHGAVRTINNKNKLSVQDICANFISIRTSGYVSRQQVAHMR